MEPKEAPPQVERRRQPIGGEAADAAIGGHEVKRRLRGEKPANPERLAKMGEVWATSHRHVLTEVDRLTGDRVVERRRPSPKTRLRLEEGQVESMRSKGDGGREARQTAADDGDPWP